jgi:hypothetical protein
MKRTVAGMPGQSSRPHGSVARRAGCVDDGPPDHESPTTAAPIYGEM